jgi:hypothetical protein
LNSNIAEGVTSSILLPCAADMGTSFNDVFMEDSFGASEGEEADKTVMCTTGLGLLRLTPEEDGSENRTYLLRPGVALHTVLGILASPESLN